MNAPVSKSSRQERLRAAIDHAAHHLPSQGPIARFVHHNTLHAFQHLPFHEAVVEAHRVFGAEPYPALAWYLDKETRGRIPAVDVDAVLLEQVDADPIFAGGPSRRDLRRLLMRIVTSDLDDELVRFRMAESGELADEARKALWEAAARFAERERLVEKRDLRRAPPPTDAVLAVNEEIYRLVSLFLDQGLAYWPMPSREGGFYLATRELYTQPGHLDPPSLRGAARTFRAQAKEEISAAELLLRFLDQRGIEEAAWPSFIEETLLLTPGWSGIVHILEHHPELAPTAAFPCSLVDFLAVRFSLESIVEATDLDQEELYSPPRRLVLVLEIYELSKGLGWDAEELAGLPATKRRSLASELVEFDDVARRRLWQLAYERHYFRGVLAGLATFRAEVDPNREPPPAKAQVFFCIDDREESLRRHFEELDPRWETFGAAGFYNVALEYRGHDEARPKKLAPVPVAPDLIAVERPVEMDQDKSHRRALRRKLAASLGRGAWVGSRGLFRGWFATAGLGLLSALPLSGRLLFPGTYGKLEKNLTAAFLPKPRTQLDVACAVCEDAVFSADEKAKRVAATLRTAGLTRRFAPLVAIIGHGSSSLNNPHWAAYDCGACSGGRGGPNARLYAAIANEPAVREALRNDHGIDLPDGTWFIGGYHDTASDAMEYYDLEDVPAALRPGLDELVAALDEARAKNAHERCRLFESAPKNESPKKALAHVEARTEHLAEPRPECGHATNALCIVGRRALTRGLYLDRRAFLVSYDPTEDHDGEVLGPLLASMGPVGAGINLEYYFSYVDNERYGCGTKLPHNLTALLGVVNGQASDLRTGLPWQMVELHEPMRLLNVVEATPETLLAIAERYPAVGELVTNEWILLASVHPETGEIQVFEGGRFVPFTHRLDELPQLQRSVDHYAGKSFTLPVAMVRSGLAHPNRSSSSSSQS
ncbi:MAG: DUF2309 domain-containing protein [Polyangiaceae bacterium]